MRLLATIADPRVIRRILAHWGLPTEGPAARSVCAALSVLIPRRRRCWLGWAWTSLSGSGSRRPRRA